MIRLPQRVLNLDPQRADDELAETWEHLAAPAEHGAGQLEPGNPLPRRAGTAAGRRGAARSEPPTTPPRRRGTQPTRPRHGGQGS